jgi:hypothetical protein
VKNLLIIVGAVATLVFAVVQIRSCSTTHQVLHSSIVQEYPMTCLDCKKPSRMTLEQMSDFRRKGQFEAPPSEYARFPCPLCSKTACVVDDHYGDTQNK